MINSKDKNIREQVSWLSLRVKNLHNNFNQGENLFLDEKVSYIKNTEVREIFKLNLIKYLR
jgi:hypothetical protein